VQKGAAHRVHGSLFPSTKILRMQMKQNETNGERKYSTDNSKIAVHFYLEVRARSVHYAHRVNDLWPRVLPANINGTLSSLSHTHSLSKIIRAAYITLCVCVCCTYTTDTYTHTADKLLYFAYKHMHWPSFDVSFKIYKRRRPRETKRAHARCSL
jgi:hypothetical protein